MLIQDFSNPEAEAAVLGTLLVSSNYLSHVSDVLDVKHFHLLDHQKIYQKILELSAKSMRVDLVTMKSFFENEVEGGKEYANTLASHALILGLRDYAFTIIELWQKRELKFALDSLRNELSTESAESVSHRLQDTIASLSVETEEVRIFDGDDLTKVLEESWSKGVEKDLISTGIKELDDMLNGGLAPNNLYVLGAAPGTGKTSFAQQVILEALKKDLGVMFISLEIKTEKVFARFLGNLASINPFRIAINRIFKHEKEAFERAMVQWSSLKKNFFMTEKGGLTAKQIESVIKRRIKKNPIKLVVVDYIQEIARRDSKTISEASLIKENVMALVEIAKTYNVAVLGLSQLTKDALDDKPSLKALKGSGGLGEAAHCVINLWSGDDEQKNKTKLLRLHIAKNRDGISGDLVLNYDGEFGRFTNNNI